jgi:SAM-dependent methyltransferase
MTPITDSLALATGLAEALTQPRNRQPEAVKELSARIEIGSPEEWNSKFGPESLFDAWTGNHLVQGIYQANAKTLQSHLRPGWRVIEIGGGDGRLWSMLPDLPPGELWVVDPSAGVHERLQAELGDRIKVHGIQALIQDALPSLPKVDAVVCSLTLHHVAGRDAQERANHGMSGPGKLEVLQGLRHILQDREGLLLLNEADVHCDLELASGDPLLRDRLLDSYVRRTAKALCREMSQLERDGDPENRLPRLLMLVKHWCLDQVQMAELPIAERDVYELDVPRWLALFDQAELDLLERGFTDDSLLFHRYLLRPRSL